MRVTPLLISGIITIGLILVLNRSWTIGDKAIPPPGSFLSPQQGFWQNAEPADQNFSLDLHSLPLKERVDVYFDERLVPHIFAQNDEDLYFVQGYLHARFRLWQMEFQTLAASGRLSEVLGAGPNNAILNNDRNMRRVGMVFGAKNSLQVMEADPFTKSVMDAYTAGVNAYIENLPTNELPLEYRLLNYAPEKWTNLKTALFLKYMSYDLTGGENDIEFSNARNVLSQADFDKMYPVTQDSLDPIVPKGTVFPPPGIHPKIPADADSAYFQWKKSTGIIPMNKPDKDNGSNNWAVSGSKTQSGRPILCNDPHLGLNLPSLWFEMQLHTPKYNVYGASLPGSPAIIIGFNDNCAWGVTNAERDVKDYYSILFKKDTHRQLYWFHGEWRPTDLHVDTFNIKGSDPFLDTVAYTIFGPVQYDAMFTGDGRTPGNINLAVRWKAHDGSDELKTFCLLNRAANYGDYKEAIENYSCPGQNFLFAAKNNEIAIWQQAQFPAKWKRQGDFIMPGQDSSYMWQGNIPQEENPHVLLNSDRSFLSSANQLPADTTYPYYLGGYHDLFRSYVINRYLRQMNDITPKDMERLQTNNQNVMAEMLLPVLFNNIDESALNDDERIYLNQLRSWKVKNDPDETGATIFQVWLDSLQREVWSDEIKKAPQPVVFPQQATLIEALRKDPAFKFIDNINTPGIETLADVVTASFKKAVPELKKADDQGRLTWGKFKDAGIRHLLRLAPFSRYHLSTGGGYGIINSIKKFHGPSWRMVVQLTDKTEAYGIYPGGQSGNPGSKYYDNFINDWAGGKYNTLWVMDATEKNDKRILSKMTFSK